MNDIEERLRVEFQLLTDRLVAPPLADRVMSRAKRRRRMQQSGVAGGTALLVALVVLVVNVLHDTMTNSAPAKSASVGSYFPNKQPPLPPRVVVQQLPATARPPQGPTRDEVIRADRAFWQSEPNNPKWQHLPSPPSGGDLRSADLVLVSAPGYQRPEGLGRVTHRVAWMLVSINARYVYGSTPATLTGPRFEFIDATTGAGLLAIGTNDRDAQFATTVVGYTRSQPPPPPGARGLAGGAVPLNAIDAVLPAPSDAHPVITKQQAYDAYSRYDLSRSAPLDAHPHSADLVELAQLKPPPGDPDYQDATWHRTLVWLVVVRDVALVPLGGPYRPPGANVPPRPTSSVGVAIYPVDATTGQGLFFETEG